MIKTGWRNKSQNGKAEALQILGISFAKVQQWERAEQIILTIEDSQERARALQKLGEVLFQFQHLEQAKHMWDRTKRSINMLRSDAESSKAFSELGVALAHAQQWKQAEQLWVKAEQLIGEVKANRWSHEQVEAAIQSLAAALAHAQQWRVRGAGHASETLAGAHALPR